MFHLELFSSSIASGANTFAQVTYSTSENILPKLVSGMQVSPLLPYLMAMSGVSANLVHIRAQSNSMLPFPYITLSPNNRGTGFESPPRLWDYSAAPIPLKPTEEFDVFATQNAGAAQTPYIGAWFSDGHATPLGVPVMPAGLLNTPNQPGRMFTVHSSTTTTLTAGGWASVTLSLDQALYAGFYALVGARVFSATGILFRLIPQMGPVWRPGGICVQAYDSLDARNQRYLDPITGIVSSWGTWLQFYSNVVPNIEIFATAADTAQEAWLDLVYIGPQTIMGAF